MLKINYNNRQSAYPDILVEYAAQRDYNSSIEIKACFGSDHWVNVSTENYLYATQTLIKEGKIDFNNVEFYFEGKLVGKANKRGKIDNYPDGFHDLVNNFLDRMLDL